MLEAVLLAQCACYVLQVIFAILYQHFLLYWMYTVQSIQKLSVNVRIFLEPESAFFEFAEFRFGNIKYFLQDLESYFINVYP